MLMYQDRPLAEPLISPENQAFFEATKTGKFMIRHCNACGRTHYYPRNICPLCGSDDTKWMEAKGTGEIYSYSVLRKGVEIPYALAYVKIDEGLTVLTNIVDCDLDAIKIGMRVEVCFKNSPAGASVAMFRPL